MDVWQSKLHSIPKKGFGLTTPTCFLQNHLVKFISFALARRQGPSMKQLLNHVARYATFVETQLAVATKEVSS